MAILRDFIASLNLATELSPSLWFETLAFVGPYCKQIILSTFGKIEASNYIRVKGERFAIAIIIFRNE